MREKLYELQETQPWGDGELFCEELTKKKVKEYRKAFRQIPGYFRTLFACLDICCTVLLWYFISQPNGKHKDG